MDHLASSLENLLKSGSLGGAILALGLAYCGGILSSLTPCIYPMIPITIGVVGGIQNHSQSANRRGVFLRGIAYVSGMAIIYAFLGVLAGITGQVFGSFTNTAHWYLGLAIVMTFASLMMMDIIPFDPQAWLDRMKRAIGPSKNSKTKLNADAVDQEATLIGAFVLGASSGFIAAPCTTPVLTAILGFIAQTQSVLLGLGLMIAFALGLGTILLAIAFFAGSFQKLPRAGAWMHKIKIGSGILILLFAEYLIYKAGKA
jgi:cytochrome c-type biogenesis protein